MAEIPLSLTWNSAKPPAKRQRMAECSTHLDTGYPRQGRALGLVDGLEANVQHARFRDDDVLAQLEHGAEEPLPNLAVLWSLRNGLRYRVQFGLLNDTPVVEVSHGAGP